MKTIIIMLCVFLVFLLTGCSSEPEYVELDRENIAELNPSKVKEVCIVTHSHEPGMLFYSYDFPIKNPEKIKIIIESIQDAKQIEDYYRNVLWPHFPEYYIKDPNQSERTLRQSRKWISFRTRKAKYGTQIAWDDELAYGLWWQSSELSKNFKKWNLFEDISKADPNWPAPDWTKNPPESDTYFLTQSKLPWNRYFLSGMRKKSIKVTKENFSQLDANETKEVCIVSKYTYVFPIDDPEKIKTFFQLMRDATQKEHDIVRNRDKLYFVIGDELYDTDIYWDNKSVYGNWWQSSDLLKLLEEWGLEPSQKQN